MHDIGSLGSSSGATASNGKGVVVGWSFIDSSTMRGFATRIRCGDRPSGELLDLGSLGGSWSMAEDVNDKDQVVGLTSLRLASGGVIGAPFFRDARGGSVDLPLLAGSTFGQALALNERSVVVGTCLSIDAGVVAERAALWQRSRNGWSITELGAFAGTTRTVPTDIDEQDRVVGFASVDGVDWQGFLWIDGVFHPLDDLLVTPEPVHIVQTGGMNARGDIAAEGHDARGEYRAFLLMRVR